MNGTIKSSLYQFRGRLFRYNYQNSMVEYICKADPEDVADDEARVAAHKPPLYNIDEEGFMVITTIGLHRDNWNNEGARREYLSQWSNELDEEVASLAHNFLRFEYPVYKEGGQ